MREFYSGLREELIINRAGILIIAAITFAASAVLLFYPTLAEKFVQGMQLSDPERPNLLYTVFIWGLVVLLHAALAISSLLLSARLGEEITAQLRSRVYSAVQFLPFQGDSVPQVGDQIARLTNDTYIVGYFISNSIPLAALQIFTATGAWCLLLVEYSLVAILLVAVCLPVFFALKLVSAVVRKRSKALLDANSRLFNLVEENRHAHTVVKAYGIERRESMLFDPLNQNLKRTSISYYKWLTSLAPGTRSLATLFALGLLYYLASNSLLTSHASETTKLLFYMFLVIRPVSTLAGVTGKYAEACAALARLQELHYENDRNTAVKSLSLSKAPLILKKPKVAQLQGISFGYKNNPPLYNDLSLTISRGKIYVLKGANGCGKSTLGYFLMRFMKPDKGVVKIDDRESQQITKCDWRGNFGYLPQQPMLRNMTLMENIILGRGFDQESVIKAIHSVGGGELISSLPDGLLTSLGPGGSNISGGQRQLVSLARAIIGNPSFLILDEPSTGLDSSRLDSFLTNKQKWASDAGVLIITHEDRFSELADERLHLTNEKIVVH